MLKQNYFTLNLLNINLFKMNSHENDLFNNNKGSMTILKVD